MKRLTPVVMLLMIALSLVVPGRTALAIDEPYWTVTNNTLEANGVPTPEDDPVIIEAKGTALHYLEAFGSYAGGYECTGEACGEMPVYLLLDITVTWDTDYEIPPDERQYIWYEWGSLGIESDNHEEVECSTGAVAGTCSVQVILTMTSEEIDHELVFETHIFEANVWLTWKLEGVWSWPTYQISTEAKIAISSDESLLAEWGDCSGQFLLGAQIGAMTLAATNAYGENMQTAIGTDYPLPGAWMAIRVLAGYWKNQSIGAELRTLAMKYGGEAWASLSVGPYTGCVDDVNATYYIQVPPGMQPLYLRVADNDADFASNSGALSIGFYSITAYTPYPSGCELNYVIGEFIEAKTVQGNFSNGLPIEQSGKQWNPRGGASDYVAPKRYYMLETYGGPFTIGSGTYSYEADLGVLAEETDTVPEDWYAVDEAPFVECVVQTDTLGHVKVFFAIDEQVDLYEFIRYWYAFRAHDEGSYTDNTGSLSYRLYMATDAQVIDPGTVPEVDGCLQFSHDAEAVSTTIIYGNDSDGTLLGLGDIRDQTIYNDPTPDGRVMIAIEVEDGPWEDDSVESYRIQISNDDGDSWNDLEDYPYLLCSQSADGDHYLIYAMAADGQVWRARVDDGDADFTNNTLSINVSVYAGQTSIDPFPTCEENYTLTYIADYTVPGNIETGKEISEITGGAIWSIEVTGDAVWYDDGGEDGSYLLEISDDGGTTWENFDQYADLCTEMIGNNGQFQIYFTGEEGVYKLRVRDTEDFLANTGSVIVKLYSGEDTANPDPDHIPPEWVVACSEMVERPDSVIEWYGIVPVPRVADWLNYVRYAITYYFAWCPEHTEALQQIGGFYTDREPLASIFDLRDFVYLIRDTLEGYLTVGGEGTPLESMEPDLFSDFGSSDDATGGAYHPGEPIGSNPLELLTVWNVTTESNPWFGGELEFDTEPTVDHEAMDAYRAICTDQFEPLFGITTWGYCYINAWMRYTQIVTMALLALDIGATLWFFLKYFPGWLRRVVATISGGKDVASDAAGLIF